MDDETREALEGSIKKWEDIAGCRDKDRGTDNCPLCVKFADFECCLSIVYCMRCPVKKHIGDRNCIGTPYKDWVDHHKFIHGIDHVPYTLDPTCPTCVDLAQQEIKFLKSLRPKEGKDSEQE